MFEGNRKISLGAMVMCDSHSGSVYDGGKISGIRQAHSIG